MNNERVTEIIYKNSHDCSEGLIINFENIQKVIGLLSEKENELTFMDKNMVLEGNKMIAEFMGWKFIYKGKDYKVWNPDFKSEEQPPNDWVFATWIKDDFEEYMSRILRYHLSWDWLMPVIEKLNTNHAIIFEYTISLIPICKVMFVPKNDIHLHFVSNESNNITGLEAVFSQVVKFLKWHNAQKAQLSEPKV